MAKGHARAAREPKPVPVEVPKKSSKAGKVNPDFGGTGYAVLTGAMVKKIKKNPSKKRGVDEHGSTNTLCHLSDKEDREKCYAEAASLLAQREADILPTFGGRKWRVSVEIKEDARRIREVQKRDEKNKNKGAATSRGASLSDLQNGPLFRWYKNELELAILPNMIQELDIRVLVDLKDEVTYRTVSELNAHKTIHDVVNRNSQDKGLRITEQALRDDVFKPIIKTIWISPQYECIRNWDDVVKTCKELSNRSKVIDRVIYGLGAKGNVMQPKKASTTEALDAGQYRFEKDGLWVVGQENSWQAGNTLILARKAALGLKDDDGFEGKKQPSTFRIVHGKALYIEANKQDFALEKRAELGRIRLADQKAERQKQKALEKLEAARIAKEEADRRAREIVHEKLEAARLAKEEEERLARLAAMPPPPESTLVGGGVPVPVPAPNPAALAEPEGRPRERKAKTAAKNANSSYSKYIEEPLPSQKYIPKKKEPSKYSYTLHMAIRDLGRKYDELPTEEKKVWETQALLANMKAEEAVLKKEREEAVIERKKLFWENREKKHRGPCEPPTEEDMAKDVKPKIGMEVKVRYDDGNWYLGKVTAVDAPFVKLEYEDGETAKEKYEDDDLCLIESEEDIKQREFEAEVLARKEAEDRRLEAELVEKAAAMVPIPMLFGDTLSEAKPMIPQRTITVMAVQPGMQPIAQPRKYKVKSTASAVMKAQGLTGKVCKSCSQFALRGNYGFCAQHRTPLQRVPNPRPPQQLVQPVLAVQQQPVVQQPAVVVQPVAQAQPQQPVPVAQHAEQFNPPPQPPQPMQVVPQFIPQIIEAPVMNNKQQAASVDEFGRLLAEALNKNPLPAPQFSIPVAAVAAMQGRGAWQQPTPPQPPQYVPQPPAPPQPVAQPQPVLNSVMAMPPAVTMSNESPCLPPPGTTKVQLPEFQNWLQHRRQEWRSNVNNNASAKAGDTVSGGVLATATPQPVQAPEPIPVPVPVKVDPAVQERMRMQAIQQQQMAIQQQQIRQRQVQEHLQRAREFKQKQEEYKKEQTNRSNATLVDQACRIFSPVDDQWHNATCKGYDKETMEHEFQIGRKETKKIDINKYMILWEKDRVNHKSDQYGLNEEQIRVCYDAAIDHYEQVMHTVKSRGLAHELQEGFDVLRERGFGRYDMTVPEYSKFEFLTSPNAAWMPIVHRCLGEKVERVHMGCFLSLPGSHHQIYHQDGVHLSETTQRPCHAVNVFIPLVDLCMANGPTEFVLGSHILENDDYDRSKIETPTAPAGSPVIFDYRTGHRGMGNSTEEARPILYLTYSADGKFSDKVNFDQRSFHKLGQMVEMPKSRDERKKERGVHPPKVEKVEGGTLEGGTCGDSAGVGHQQEHEHHHHDLNNNTVATSTNMEVEVVGSMPAATKISPPTPAAPCLQPMVGVTMTSSAPVVTQPDPVAPPVAPPAAPPVAQPVVFQPAQPMTFGN
ncbi:hypothetical protein TrVE_jg2538 [Triparma verrucosa]|uniref:Tudor domain-containing protein n=1 Tax=Triparma verrucosa TaxID=1606542 RepID=A0A9W7C6I6_9STRA|nr:hypothetical protein TrVE_jg2538 [Triparma verrucosa]